MKKIFVFLIIFCFLSKRFFAQESDILNQGSGGFDPSMYMDSDLDDHRGDSREKKVEKFQTFFIQEVFTKPMFEMQNTMFQNDEDDDEDSLVGSKQDNDMMNMILANVLARDLAKKDAFRMKKILLKRADEF